MACAPAPAPTPQIVESKSRVSTNEVNGQGRTEANSRVSVVDGEGAKAESRSSAERFDQNGTVSRESKVVSASSDGNADASAGYTHDDKNVAVSGSNVTRTIDVNGQDVAVSGSGNTLTFSGDAHGLSVTGSDNKISVPSPEMIDVSGARNTVTYSGTTNPTVKQAGEGNSVTAAP